MNARTKHSILIHARACLRSLELAHYWQQRLTGTRSGANARVQMHANLDNAAYRSQRAFAAAGAAT